MADLRREATELIAVGALEEDRRRREVADLARREVLGRRIQGILFLIRVTKSLEHTWADIVELVQEVVEDERGGRRPSRRLEVLGLRAASPRGADERVAG